MTGIATGTVADAAGIPATKAERAALNGGPLGLVVLRNYLARGRLVP